MTSLQTELASLRAENMELKNNVTICVVRMGELHKQVTLLRQYGAAASVSLGAFVSDEGWSQADMDNMDNLDAALAATAPKEFT